MRIRFPVHTLQNMSDITHTGENTNEEPFVHRIPASMPDDPFDSYSPPLSERGPNLPPHPVDPVRYDSWGFVRVPYTGDGPIRPQR
jgi:hypothetical protein